jgi:hypothetical protein
VYVFCILRPAAINTGESLKNPASPDLSYCQDCITGDKGKPPRGAAVTLQDGKGFPREGDSGIVAA